MTKGHDQSENLLPESLETRLRNIPRFSAPAALKHKLLGDIPDTASSPRAVASDVFLRRAWAGAAAVIFVCVLALVINYGTSLLPNTVITEVNIASTGNNVIDRNNTHIVDTNRAGTVNRQNRPANTAMGPVLSMCLTKCSAEITILCRYYVRRS